MMPMSSIKTDITLLSIKGSLPKRVAKMKQRRVYGITKSSTAEATHHALVNFARDSHVVEIVFANKVESSGLVEIENFAAFNLGRLAGLNSQGPGDVVEANPPPVAQPPMSHCVEYSANVVVAEIHKRPRRDAVHQAALENKG